MGLTYSFLESEKKTWIEHNLQFDRNVRASNLQQLGNLNDGTEFLLAYSTSKWGGLEYQHWFVTDRTHFIEFGSASLDIYSARVTINTLPHNDYVIQGNSGGVVSTKMDQAIRDRIRHVIGMSNYSLCLRNCEHVANYIFRGRWVSNQMDSMLGYLFNFFKSHFLNDTIRLVNTFPSCIRPHVFNPDINNKLYSFIDNHYIAQRFDYYLDSAENTYNVLLIGPTGAGKSHLINVIFNLHICDSEVSHRGVTKEIYFLRGQGNIFDEKEQAFVQRQIVVADTIGLCDAEWDEKKLFDLIRGRVSANFNHIDAVYVLFRADRLLQCHVDSIKRILSWLRYTNNILRFQFVGTYADYLNEAKKDLLRKEATEILGLVDTRRAILQTQAQQESYYEYESLIYTGFPPEETLNALTKSRVLESWNKLGLLLNFPGTTPPITFDGRRRCVIL